MSEEIKPTDVENYPAMWEKRWETGATGWDQSKSHPTLVGFLNSPESDTVGVAREGKAFVPGCGQGYDVDLFARRGLDATGLDVAPTGVVSANKWLEAENDKAPRKASAKVVEGDFFKFNHGEGYDLIYDYTFLCALPPTLRAQWGQRMTTISRAAPGTRLVTLQYPLNGNPPPFGPPFSLTEDEYVQHLGKDWEVVWSKDVPEEQKRVNTPPGGERLVVWKRKL